MSVGEALRLIEKATATVWEALERLADIAEQQEETHQFLGRSGVAPMMTRMHCGRTVRSP